jgi:DNA recombination protein RmuC
VVAALWARGATAAGRGELARSHERVVELESFAEATQLRQKELEGLLASRDRENSDLRVAEARAVAELENQRLALQGLRDELKQARAAESALKAEQQKLAGDLAGTAMELRKERESNQEKLTLLTEARDQLSYQFRTLANEILEEKSQRFAEQNKASLDQLLLPLRDQLTGFKTTVERAYIDEGKERSALAEQVKQLAALNLQLSSDAMDLTKALKGSTKTQGNWGEMVLESILEAGGLRKGLEYRVQESFTREDGSRVIPDVILHLPEGKHLVIDAKVSLLDYHDHVNGQVDAERERAAASHIASMRAHIKGLSEKDYRSLHSLHTVDFVIMFVPIEPAFMLGIGRDPNLWTHAWERNVLLVSPSTLLFVVRTVSHIWKQEQQRDNVKEIARQGGELYDKFSSFVNDLNKLGDQLNRAKDSYDLAFNKLSRGKGNLVNRAQSLRRMGIKVSKPLPDGLVQGAAESDDEKDAFASGPRVLDLAAFSEGPEE